MTDPIAVQEKLRAIMQKHWPAPPRQEDLSDYLACEDAILAAFPELTAPDKDMAEGAQEVIGKWMALTPVALNCAQDVAAFATACVAKATERHRAEVEQLTRERDEARNAANYAEALAARAINERESAEAALSAAQKRIAELEGEASGVFEYFFGTIACRASRDADMEYKLLSSLRAALAEEIDNDKR